MDIAQPQHRQIGGGEIGLAALALDAADGNARRQQGRIARHVAWARPARRSAWTAPPRPTSGLAQATSPPGTAAIHSAMRPAGDAIEHKAGAALAVAEIAHRQSRRAAPAAASAPSGAPKVVSRKCADKVLGRRAVQRARSCRCAWAKPSSAITWNSELSGACAATRHSCGRKAVALPCPQPAQRLRAVLSVREESAWTRRHWRRETADRNIPWPGCAADAPRISSSAPARPSKVSETVRGFISPLVMS